MLIHELSEAHGPEQVEGLLGKVASSILCPFLPAGRQGPRSEERGLRGTSRSNKSKLNFYYIKSYVSTLCPPRINAGV
jgi:hypothetical protein